MIPSVKYQPTMVLPWFKDLAHPQYETCDTFEDIRNVRLLFDLTDFSQEPFPANLSTCVLLPFGNSVRIHPDSQLEVGPPKKEVETSSGQTSAFWFGFTRPTGIEVVARENDFLSPTSRGATSFLAVRGFEATSGS